MRAIVCREYGSPEGLEVGEAEKPKPRAGEVLVRVEAAGLGFVDGLTVAGLYQIKPKLPFIPGGEVAGVVEALGEGAARFRVGQRVLGSPGTGGLAEYAALHEARCAAIPDSLPADAAAAFLVNYCTAWHGLGHCGRLQPKETLLVLGASGGVGMAAIDVGKAMGATVIAAASTEAKRQACLDAGAEVAIDYSVENWRETLKAALGDKQLDMVYDPVGGAFAEPALRSLGPGGRFMVVGFAGGEIPRLPMNLPLLKRCSIVGVNWGGHLAANPDAAQQALAELLAWVEEGRLSPVVGERFPLAQASAAIQKLLARQAIGKLVVLPAA